jgi:hypothetical protein
LESTNRCFKLDLDSQFDRLILLKKKLGGLWMKKNLIVASGILVLGVILATILQKPLEKNEEIPTNVDIYDYSDETSTSEEYQDSESESVHTKKKRWTTSQRPKDVPQGFVYFDTSLNQLVYWNGKIWVEKSYINMKEFGAKGDGITDDTLVIQNALNLARDYGNIKLYFPKGTYNTQRLRLYSNTAVTLNPKAIIRRSGTGYKLFINGEFGNQDYATGYNGEGNIHFKGGTIDLNTIHSPIPYDRSTTAFDIAHADNISFTNLKIINGQNGHYFQIASSKKVLFDGCWFGNVRYTNTNSMNFELIQIEEASKISFPTFGSYDETISRDITIKNNHFENVIRAIGTHSYPRASDGNTPLRYVENVRIVNNVFKNSISSVGHFEAFNHLIFENNILENYGEQPIFFKESKNTSVKNNKYIP